MDKIYCTYFDKNYFVQGVTMIQSLKKNDVNSKIYVLALDDFVEKNLVLPGVETISLTQILTYYPTLSELRKYRKKVEFYFTLTPFILSYVADKNANADCFISYVDADLFFFNSIDVIFDDMRIEDVGIIPHNYSKKNINNFLKYGIYNVGLVIFKNTSPGIQTINWWRDRCEEWCKDIPDDGKFADQGYLDYFSKICSTVKIVNHPGANLAPWNIDNYKISILEDEIFLENEFKLLFFHFHGLRKIRSAFFPSHIIYRNMLSTNIKEFIYRPYLQEMLKNSNIKGVSLPKNSIFQFKRSRGLKMLISNFRNLILLFFLFISSQYILEKGNSEHAKRE